MSRRERRNTNSTHDGSERENNANDFETRQRLRGGDHRTGTQTDSTTMRCFCGCTPLTYEQIEHVALMNVGTLVVHSTGRKLFENFLRIGHHTDKSEATSLLECHEMCDKFLRNLHLIHSPESVDDLFALCPSFECEQRLASSIHSDDLQSVRQGLIELKRECIHNIESHNDYDRFRRELLRKIGK